MRKEINWKLSRWRKTVITFHIIKVITRHNEERKERGSPTNNDMPSLLATICTASNLVESPVVQKMFMESTWD
jgi:hypothetical protein